MATKRNDTIKSMYGAYKAPHPEEHGCIISADDRPYSVRVNMSGAMAAVLDNLARRSGLLMPDLIRFVCSQYIESDTGLEIV